MGLIITKITFLSLIKTTMIGPVRWVLRQNPPYSVVGNISTPNREISFCCIFETAWPTNYGNNGVLCPKIHRRMCQQIEGLIGQNTETAKNRRKNKSNQF
jgi:hypothetical protein